MQEEQEQVQVSGYRITKTLGKGTFGKVRIATHITTQQKVAVKILEKELIQDPSDVERISRQIKILKKVQHPFITTLYEIVETQSRLYLFMEYANEGDLFNKICNHRKIKQDVAAVYYLELLQGLKYLHQQGITHRDLKPENLLIDNNVIKIADFGLGNFFQSGGQLKTACGSPCYAAPEMISKQSYDPVKVDIWSSGIVLYAMVMGYLPFEDSNVNSLYAKIKKGEFTIPQYVSPQLKQLLRGILNMDPVARFTVQQSINHAWIKLHNLNLNIVPHLKIDQLSVSAAALEHRMDKQKLQKALNSKKHNALTTTFYLWMKKQNRIKDDLVQANSIPNIDSDTLSQVKNQIKQPGSQKKEQARVGPKEVKKQSKRQDIIESKQIFMNNTLQPVVQEKIIAVTIEPTTKPGLNGQQINDEILKVSSAKNQPYKQKPILIEQQIKVQLEVTKKKQSEKIILRKVSRMPTQNMKKTATRLYERSGSRQTDVSVRLNAARKNKLLLKRIQRKPRLLNVNLFFDGHVQQLRDFVKKLQPQNNNILVEYFEFGSDCLYIVKTNLDVPNMCKGLAERYTIKL